MSFILDTHCSFARALVLSLAGKNRPRPANLPVPEMPEDHRGGASSLGSSFFRKTLRLLVFSRFLHPNYFHFTFFSSQILSCRTLHSTVSLARRSTHTRTHSHTTTRSDNFSIKVGSSRIKTTPEKFPNSTRGGVR